MKVFITADTHFHHTNIIKYCNRPFKDVSEMDFVLVKNWNSVVGKDDIVYFLGDFCFGSATNVMKLLDVLNGTIHFIYGNHDRAISDFRRLMQTDEEIRRKYENKIKFLGFYNKVYIDNQMVILIHYAMRVWEASHYGSYQLYGHSHGSLPDNPNALQMDVGVDCHNYTPITFEKVKEIMAGKTFKPVDHHR